MVFDPKTSEIRLHKIIASSGLCSLRAAEQLIIQGRVSVNGKYVNQVGQKALPSDRICVDDKPIQRVETLVYAFNKPKGVVCSQLKQGQNKLATDYFPNNLGLHTVGRLDKDSEGLIIVTNDGVLTNKITHPSFEHIKVYHVLCRLEKDAKPISLEDIKKKLISGVKLSDGKAKALKADIKPLADFEYSIYITVSEGRHHLIRRMLATLGLDVKKLKRIMIGKLELGNLKIGESKLLSKKDIELLYA